MELKILETDKFFNDSPNTGEVNCLCSRCSKPIPEEEIPLSIAIDSDVFVVRNQHGQETPKLVEVANGYEFRLCETCQLATGLKGAN